MSDLQGKLLKLGTGFRLVLSFNLLLQVSCWDETGDVNRFSHSQLVSEQGTSACMWDLLRCLTCRGSC